MVTKVIRRRVESIQPFIMNESTFIWENDIPVCVDEKNIEPIDFVELDEVLKYIESLNK